jgi:hypothetical protein
MLRDQGGLDRPVGGTLAGLGPDDVGGIAFGRTWAGSRRASYFIVCCSSHGATGRSGTHVKTTASRPHGPDERTRGHRTLDAAGARC